ncbi:Similar to CTDP1: RNA polymerase II subunit A C-terminal domain phosphatase (Homo sapiens) [Cotesia congregata]|uniref:RNA polymerase II subunit A C-terminal domain phosphatase n=1 Tax=Cotesia congregata TaxID=51543 RepID=A0A8J2HCI3_COTCN|nr:Similar to CTDP1: RNA polymerase II subunit A C-terminal domain phosphatase (Homo sapiens) [Cotesia congregata]
MASIEIVFPRNEQPGKIKKWRVATGSMISARSVLFLYCPVNSNGDDTQNSEEKYRSTQSGRITQILAKEGDTIQPGQVIFLMTVCTHPTVIKDLCGRCGADLQNETLNKDGKDKVISEASVPMLHSIPELKVCPELAEKIGKEDEQRLLKDRKLALLVDLDQTIVHTTNDTVPAVMKDVFHYQLYGPNSPWYHTRLRPGTNHFLQEMSKMYELHICTFGARKYAHTVAALLDKEGKLFSQRILSRDECFNSASKTANLKALFPCGDDLVCIIDDREDVWQGCGNLVQVKPYHFFRHTGDIHAPPGLEKRDPPDQSSSPEEEIGSFDTEEQSINTNKNNNENGVNDNVSEETPEDDKKEGRKEIDSVVIKSPEDSKESDKTSETAVSSESSKDKQSNENVDNKSTTKTKDQNNDGEIKSSDVPLTDVKKSDETEIEDNDHDDYLLYLEDILRRVHNEFYKNIDNNDRKPLREIIPQVRVRVLEGLCLTFSGLVPTNHKLEQSRAYKVAVAFGAKVTQDLTESTTHLVAIKPGTAKANTAKKNPNIKIVNPDWLWSCAERWEHVDERLFPLTAQARGSRVPPPHCSSPEHVEVKESEVVDSFANSINPLMSFTQEEIDIMDKEVDDDMSDVEVDSYAVDGKEELDSVMDDESENSSDLNDELYGSPKKRQKIQRNSSSDSSEGKGKDYDINEDNDDDDDEDPVIRFRRGEPLPDDLDLGDQGSQDSVEIDDPAEEEDDREWNAMGAALEREFLSE